MNVRFLRRLALALAAAFGVGCSSSGSMLSGQAGTSGTGGAAGTSAAGGHGASAGSTGTGGGGGGPVFVNAAVCGERGDATVTTSAYDGTAQFYIIGDGGLGLDVCVIQFDVHRIGAAPAGCANCSWTHLVQYSNPTVVTDVDGACEANDSVPATDAAGRAAYTGTQIARGFSVLAGHGDEVMKYADATQGWVAVGHASWSDTSSHLGYDIRNGTCNYGH